MSIVDARPALVADAADLEEYPIGREVRLQGQYFLKFETSRYLHSTMALTGSPEVRCCYLELIFHSQHQTPIGTLPADPLVQARLLRVDPAHWTSLCRMQPSPLHHWRPCMSEGEVRLMHPVVLDTVIDQLQRREAAELRRGDDAVRKRIARLRERMQAAGFDKAVIGDDVLVERMDHWLAENVRGQRRQDAYDRVFRVAAAEGWFGPRTGVRATR